MKKMLLIASVLLFGYTAQAEIITLKATCSVSDENGDIDQDEVVQDGWKIVEDEFGDSEYGLNLVISTSQLPVSKYIGSMGISISKDGLLSVGMSVGDSDASAMSELLLPRNGTQLVPFQKMTLNSSGGDHASGMWSYNCKTEISVR